MVTIQRLRALTLVTVLAQAGGAHAANGFCYRLIERLVLGTAVREELQLPKKFPLTPVNSTRRAHPTTEGAWVFPLSRAQIDKLSFGTKLVDTRTGREAILGLDPMDLSVTNADGATNFGLSTTTGAQNLIRHPALRTVYHNWIEGSKGLRINDLLFSTAYLVPVYPFRQMTERARYLANLLSDRYHCDSISTEIHLHGLFHPLHLENDGSGSIVLKYHSQKEWQDLSAFVETHQLPHEFFTYHEGEPVARTDAQAFTMSKPFVRMILKLPNAEAVENYLDFLVSSVAGGEERALSDHAEQKLRRQIVDATSPSSAL